MCVFQKLVDEEPYFFLKIFFIKTHPFFFLILILKKFITNRTYLELLRSRLASKKFLYIKSLNVNF